MERRAFVTSLALGALGAVLPRAVFAENEGKWHEHVRPLMGTFVSLAIFSASEDSARKMTDACFSHLEACIAQISNWDSGSFTNRVNETRRAELTRDSRLFSRLAVSAHEVRTLSKAKFNPSILALTKLWREAKAASVIPSNSDIRRSLRLVEQSSFTLRKGEIELLGKSGIEFDGIGKGLISDLGCEFLRQNGVKFARVAASGDIRFLGPTSWDVDIEHPREERALGSLRLSGSVAIASSGDYRNCWTVNGRSYHHLIDSSTGYPGRENFQATVVARSCVVADALAVASFFMPVKDALKMLEAVPGAGGVLVDSRGKIFISKSLRRAADFSAVVA
jgi:thiamine biosynthesis lipoprotein